MIDFYFFPTPNTWKVGIFLEECGLPYRLVPVDIMKDEQFEPEFLRISDVVPGAKDSRKMAIALTEVALLTKEE